MSSDLVLVVAIGAALAFDFTNGFHDTFDVVATSVSTGAAPPQVAISVASLLNFVGAFISVGVAATIAHDVVDVGVITPTVVFAGLVGAIAWNLATWCFGLPSSSSHALIGGVVGSALAAAGVDAVHRRRPGRQGPDPGGARAACRLPRRRRSRSCSSTGSSAAAARAP